MPGNYAVQAPCGQNAEAAEPPLAWPLRLLGALDFAMRSSMCYMCCWRWTLAYIMWLWCLRVPSTAFGIGMQVNYMRNHSCVPLNSMVMLNIGCMESGTCLHKALWVH